MMNLKQAIEKIGELEARIKELEARPAQQVHYHFAQPAPCLPLPYEPMTPYCKAP